MGLGLNEAIAANGSLRGSVSMKRDVTVILQALATGIEQHQGNLGIAKLGKSAPVEVIGFTALGVRAVEGNGGRFSLDVTNERVLRREVPILPEQEIAEQLQLPLKRHAARGYVQNLNSIAPIKSADALKALWHGPKSY